MGLRSSALLTARVSHFTVIFVFFDTHSFHGCLVRTLVHPSIPIWAISNFCARAASLLFFVLDMAVLAEPHRREQKLFCLAVFLM